MMTAIGAAPLFVPRFYAYDSSGNPLSAGSVYTYVAGSSTLANSYPTFADAIAGTNANANPVVLDGSGSAAIFLQAGAFYKIVVKDSSGTTIYTVDSVNPAQAIGMFGESPVLTTNEWTNLAYLAALSSVSLAYAVPSATQITITATPSTDYSTVLTAGRRINVSSGAGTTTGTITSSSYAAGVTTINFINDGSVPTSPVSALYFGFLGYLTPSYLDPRTAFNAIKNANMTGFGSATKVTAWTVGLDSLTEWDNTNNRWVCKFPGKYLICAAIEVSDTSASIDVTLQIRKNGNAVAGALQCTHSTAGKHSVISMTYAASLAAADYIEIYAVGSANTTVYGSEGAWTVTRIP